MLKLNNLLCVSCLSLGLVSFSGCATAPDEGNYKGSSLEKETQLLLSTCEKLKMDGKLRGYGAGQDDRLIFSVDEEKLPLDGLSYPLALTCSIGQLDKSEVHFKFIKKASTSGWKLSQ